MCGQVVSSTNSHWQLIAIKDGLNSQFAVPSCVPDRTAVTSWITIIICKTCRAEPTNKIKVCLRQRKAQSCSKTQRQAKLHVSIDRHYSNTSAARILTDKCIRWSVLGGYLVEL